MANLEPRSNRSIKDKQSAKISQAYSGELNSVKKSVPPVKPVTAADCQHLQKQLEELQEKHQSIVAERDRLDKEAKVKKKEAEDLEKNIKKLQQETNRAEKQVKQKTEEASQKKIEQELLTEELAKLVKKTKQIQLQNHSHIRNIKEAEDKIKEAKDSLQNLEKSKEELQRNIEKTKKQKEQIEAQLKQIMVYDNSSLALKLEQEKKILAYQMTKVSQFKKQQFQIEKIYHEQLKALKKQQDMINALREERDILKKQTEVQAQNLSPKSLIASQDVGHLFEGDVLSDEPDYKSYLASILEKKTRSKILKTRLVYRWDPLNSNNFHKYIDGRQQIVVIIKLINGLFLGAWAEGSLIPKTPSNGEGLIFSLSHRQCFQLLEPNKKATVYDEYFLIFGNSQLRMRSQSKTVFSNFGVNNSFYRNRGFGVEVLFGDNRRETEMETYQIFEMKLRR